jgi:ABC-type glycerol-3-phosphate transport system substrate-binding protein
MPETTDRSPRRPRSGARRRLGVAAALVGALFLAGCGGIPTSGNVEAGPPITDDVEIDFGFAPQGPRSGATQEEIVQDFVIAATNPQSDYQVAREFLSEDFESEWEPDAITTIRTGAGTRTPPPPR